MNSEELIMNNEQLPVGAAWHAAQKHTDKNNIMHVGAGPLVSAQENKSKKHTTSVGACITRTSGITLIALIITIIVMLILAGVVLSLTIGERGIFKTAKGAAKNYTNAQERENLGINNLENEVNMILGEINETSDKTHNKPISSIEEMLRACNIQKDYTIEEILNNTDDILNIIFENDLASRYMIDNFLDEISNSQISMTNLGKSSIAYEKVMSNEENFNKIISSNYIGDFEISAKKVPHLGSNSDKGFNLTGTEHASYPLYNAFDEKDDTYWLTPSYGDATMYIEFPQEVKIYHFYYFIGDTFKGNYTATAYEIYGIDKEDNEHKIADGSIMSYKKDIYFYNNKSYQKYKIFFTQGSQAAGASTLDIYYR